MKKTMVLASLFTTFALTFSAHASVPTLEGVPKTPAAAVKWLEGEKQAQLAYSYICRWASNSYYYCYMTLPGPVGSTCYCPGFPNGYISYN